MDNYKNRQLASFVTIAVILLYIGIIVGWHFYSPRDELAIQSPGTDERPEGTARNIDDVYIGEFFMKYEEIMSELIGKWTCFRGEKSTNIIVTPEKVSTSDGDYPVLWTVETGEGYAAPVINNGKLYFLDYNESLNSDALRCFDLESGKELWRRWYRVPMKRNHGFSRTVPAIGDGYIITVGPKGYVMCCDPMTGDLKWSFDMLKEFKITIPQWYAGQCPLVDDNTLILAPAGEDILFAGFDCRSGEILWTTPNTLKYKMSHSSVIPMTLCGKKMYVYAGEGGVCSISAEKADIGKLLWETSKWQPSVIAPSPVQVSTNQFFICAGYGAGGALFQIERQGEKWTASVVNQYKPSNGLSSEQQTPIFYNNMLIAVNPKDGGQRRHRLVCHSPADLHNPLWTSAADERIGEGPYLIINNHLFAFSDAGELFVYEIMQQSMNLVKRQKIMEGIDAYGPLAYADGILIVSDAHTLKALKITEKI